jgi:peptidoglycan/xylan/chitin deacetylase (PgdA/CDA1 family)
MSVDACDADEEKHKRGAVLPARPVPILMYHSIAIPSTSPYVVSVQAFETQMAYLAERHYTPLTVTQFIRARQCPETLPLRPVVLTFDDGYADFYENALPVLRRHKFGATLYIVTSWVKGSPREKGPGSESGYRLLTWEQIVEISANGIECGAHTHTHSPLDILGETAARMELVRSQQILQAKIGQPVSSFAYPGGYQTRFTQHLVRATSYTSACGVMYAMSSTVDNAFALSRLPVTNDTQGADFEKLLTGRPLDVRMRWRQLQSSVWRGARSIAIQLGVRGLP